MRHQPRLVRWLVLLWWAAMMAWLVRYEAFPAAFRGRPAGYRPVMQDGVLTLDSWMRILYDGKPLGYSHTAIMTTEDDPRGYYTVNNVLNLKLNLMGTAQRIHVDTEAVLDSLYRLNRFAFRLQSGQYVMETTGRRARGNIFNLRIRTPQSEQRVDVEIPPDAVIYSPMTEMAVARLAPGESLRIRTFDPTTLSTETLLVEALRRETLAIADRDYKAVVLATDYHGMRIHSWLDRNGLMLRQETPFGWVMERCTIEDAFDALRDADAGIDVLRRLAVRCYGVIPNPREATDLHLVLSGSVFDRRDLESHRQQVIRLDETGAELRVRAQPATRPGGADLDAAAAAKYLAASHALQSDHPDIRRKAIQLTQGLESPHARARAIFDWVFKSVKKKPTVSIPSALDVLKTLEGDCNEHTYLFVALARAAGIPAAVRIGIAYAHGAFYYHAWPSVHVGEWIEMDPTWGQQRVDATHVGLLEGELVDQLALLKMIGKLEVRVLPPANAQQEERTP